MKKFILTILFLCSIVSCFAQSTHNTKGSNLYRRYIKLPPVDAEFFGLANYSFASDRTHNVGLTVGWCEHFGAYMNVMLGLNGFHYQSKDISKYGYESSVYDYWQLTNEHTTQRLSVTPGFLARLGCPLYLQVGLGYAYSTYTHKANTGEWMAWYPNSNGSCMNWQLGLMGNIKGFSLMAAYTGYGWNEGVKNEVMVGLGFAIQTKKGR